jgi:tetratricopeptide (TPR) repeat protein
MTGVCFSELPKTPEQAQAKAALIVDHLIAETEREPNNPRWWYYLGDTLLTLDRKDEALNAFVNCANLRGWDEESAWSCFRAATILAAQGKAFEAMETCAKGLARHSGMAELAWLAGEIALSAGQPDKAIYWGRIAVANGLKDGEKHLIRPRTGYRHMFGATEGPYHLMSRAYGTLGMTKEKTNCDQILNKLATKEAPHAQQSSV